MTDPDMGTWNYTLYDALGNLKTQTDARSCTANLTYDALNRLTNKSYSGCPTTTAVTYTYDGSNNFRSDPFTSLPPGWTSGGSITYSSNGAHMAGAANWSNYLSLTEYLGEGMVAEFSFQHVTANSSSVFQVNSGVSGQANYRRWGLKIHDNAIYRQSCVGAAPTCEEVWLMSLTANTWYRGQLTIDSLGQFVAKAWPVSNPSAAVQNTVAHTDWSGMAWKFKVFAITNSLDFKDYTQKQAFGVGRRTGMTDGSGSAAWSYDKRGRMTQENKIVGTSDKFTTQWAYNSADKVTSMSYPMNNLGQVEEQLVFAYSRQMALKYAFSVTNNYYYVQNDTYDAAGRVDVRSMGANNLAESPLIKTDYNYYAWSSQGGRLYQIQSGVNPGYSPTLQNLTYTYDEVGNVKTILDGANNNQKQCFTYDTLYRLTKATTYTDSPNCTTQLGNGNYDESYSYDSATGNLSSKTGIGTYTYNAVHKHAVASTTNGWSFQYDANGNMTQRVAGGTYNLTYDAENRLTASSNPANTSFVYDGDGKRVKGVTGTTTVYIGNYFEWTGSTSTMVKYYYDGATRVAMRTGSTLNWLFNDHLGSTSRSTDASGNNSSVHLYKAWGETRYSSGTIPTTYLYTGQRRESSLGGPEGLYFYGARWLDPYLNRWIQPDTIVPQSTQGVQAWDRFAYANNNPLRYTDPTGHTISCGAGETGACGGETPESRYWELRHYYLNCQNRTGQNCPNGLGIIAFTGVSLVVAGAAGPTVDSVAGATDVISQELISACVSNPICARIILGIYVYNEMESIPEQDRHHLLPQYIAKILGIDPGEGPAIYLEKPDHYLYTQLWRQLFGYKGSSNYDLTLNITKEQLIQAVETVYKGFPEYIEAIKQFLERLP